MYLNPTCVCICSSLFILQSHINVDRCHNYISNWLFICRPRCIPFPHSYLFCGEYIDASTPVYIDPNLLNYTEVNERLTALDNNKIFGVTIACRWKNLYMSCLSIYPHCNITTQALLSPCMDDCLSNTNMCYNITRLAAVLTASAMFNNNPLDRTFILNCSSPFRLFGSVNVDMKNCYNLNCKLIIIRSLPLCCSSKFITYSYVL